MRLGLIIGTALEILYWAIFVRALLSWFSVGQTGALASLRQILDDLTDPIVGPIRKLIPQTGGFDLSPLLAMILVDLLRRVVAIFF